MPNRGPIFRSIDSLCFEFLWHEQSPSRLYGANGAVAGLQPLDAREAVVVEELKLVVVEVRGVEACGRRIAVDAAHLRIHGQLRADGQHILHVGQDGLRVKELQSATLHQHPSLAHLPSLLRHALAERRVGTARIELRTHIREIAL